MTATRPTDGVIRTVTATPDPPSTGVPNPIHADQGASEAGYEGALVQGVRTYGWVADVLVAVAGEEWLDAGWADVSLRRPLFAGEAVTISVAPHEGGWSLRAVKSGERVVLEGTAGMGAAEWLSSIEPPPASPAEPPPLRRASYTVATAPIGESLRPLGAMVSYGAAHRLATADLGVEESALPPGRLHPWFLAGRMAPLARHNFTYGPTIHVRTQIQHVAPAMAGSEVIVGARIVDAYERKGHCYQTLDGMVHDGAGVELARLRHHAIFRPRGTGIPLPVEPLAAARGVLHR